MARGHTRLVVEAPRPVEVAGEGVAIDGSEHDEAELREHRVVDECHRARQREPALCRVRGREHRAHREEGAESEHKGERRAAAQHPPQFEQQYRPHRASPPLISIRAVMNARSASTVLSPGYSTRALSSASRNRMRSPRARTSSRLCEVARTVVPSRASTASMHAWRLR